MLNRQEMVLIAFLGNPGKKYITTRHNIGFIIGEYFTKEFNIKCTQKAFLGFAGVGKVEGKDVCVLVPHTYMNNSGESVIQALNFYKLEVKSLIAVHDEIEFNFGRFEMKFGGGHKGHNGIRSIMSFINTGDFYRLRFGVGRPSDPRISVSDYVLGNFLDSELVEIKDKLPEVRDMLVKVIGEAE